jgi:hydroxymethylbilane synthase
MAQADLAMQAIQGLPGSLAPEVKVITTCGDRDRCTPLEEMGGYGVFTKELDQRLLSGEIDLAVNSLKDMPSALTPGTRLLAVLPRAPVFDVLVSKVPLEDLPPSSVVGTSSVRRKALLRHYCPDLQVAELRGNITTRISKWRRGDYQAIVLAEAGLDRLGDSAPRFALDPAEWVPPAGPGALALVCREDDRSMDPSPAWTCAQPPMRGPGEGGDEGAGRQLPGADRGLGLPRPGRPPAALPLAGGGRFLGKKI